MDDLSKIRLKVFFDPAALSPDRSADFTCAPSENKTIGFIPADIIGYQWDNCFNMEQMWTELKSRMEKTSAGPDSGLPAGVSNTANIFKLLTASGQIMGLNIEGDILPAFGDEAGWFLRDIRLSGSFPVPQFLLFVKVKDEEKAKNVVGTLMKQPFFVPQNEDYKGTALQYLSLPTGGDPQPGFAFFNGYLLLGINPQIIKDTIDVSSQPPDNLAASVFFKEMDFGLTDKNRIIHFLKFDRLVDKIKYLLDWSVDQSKKQEEKQLAFKTGAEKRLEDIKKDIIRIDNEMSGLDGKVVDATNEKKKLEEQGLPTEDKEAELKTAEDQKQAKEDELKAAYAKKIEQEQTIKGYEPDVLLQEQQRVSRDDLIYPVLDGLRSIQTISARSTVEANAWNVQIFIKSGHQ